MDKHNETAAFDMLDAFGSDVGSTLDDLASTWDTPDYIDGSQGNAENMEDVGKRLAKPIYFYNPVYNLVNNNKDSSVVVMRRPSLIPLSQLTNQNNKNQTRDRSDSKTHDKKKGLFSKLAGIGRRQSKDKIDKYESSYSESVVDESIFEDTTFVRDEPSIAKPTLKVEKSTPQKPVRQSMVAELDNSKNAKEPTPDPKVQAPSPALPAKQDHPETEMNVEETMETKNRHEEGNSSFSSNQSDDGSVSSESAVTTMADVISEVNASDSEELSQKVPETLDVNQNVDLPLLKRNKTLKWSGSRKAPALIREFTRRQKNRGLTDDALELNSPNKEVEAVLLANTIMNETTSPRSCTPSQQTTSFGMEEQDPPKKPDASPSHLNASEAKVIENGHHGGNSPAIVGNSSKRDSAFYVLSSFLPPAPRLRRTQSSKVRAYLGKMGANANNALGYAVGQFVQQTLKNKESRPMVLLHDIRSFLTDIKRYLISNPHIGVVKKIQKIINYSSTVDVEGAVDDALDKLVLYPLHNVIYRCLVLDYTKSGQLKLLQEAISLAKTKSNQDLGIRPTLLPPSEEHLEDIKSHFTQLQKTYSPYFKLKELLLAVTKIYENTQDLNMEDRSARKIGADDFLPLLVHSIVHCNFVAADIEAQYIDGLLEPGLLLGEGGYYLTTLISAVQVVFSIKRREAALPNISDLQGFLKVGISSVRRKPPAAVEGGTEPETPGKDAMEDFILQKTLHVPPAMTARSLGQMITRKFNIHDPEEYCLHVIVSDVAYALEPNECPQLVKMDLLTQFPASAFFFSFQKRSVTSARLQRPTSVVQQDGILTAVAELAQTDDDNEESNGNEVALDVNVEKTSENESTTALPEIITHTTPEIVVVEEATENSPVTLENNDIDAEVSQTAQVASKHLDVVPLYDPDSSDKDSDDSSSQDEEQSMEYTLPVEEPVEWTNSPERGSMSAETKPQQPLHDDNSAATVQTKLERHTPEESDDNSPATEQTTVEIALESEGKTENVAATDKDEYSKEDSPARHHSFTPVQDKKSTATTTATSGSQESSLSENSALPKISVTAHEDSSGEFATSYRRELEATTGSFANLSKNSSLTGSIDEVFSQSMADEKDASRRETVASLTEYFESRSAQSSPRPQVVTRFLLYPSKRLLQ